MILLKHKYSRCTFYNCSQRNSLCTQRNICFKTLSCILVASENAPGMQRTSPLNARPLHEILHSSASLSKWLRASCEVTHRLPLKIGLMHRALFCRFSSMLEIRYFIPMVIELKSYVPTLRSNCLKEEFLHLHLDIIHCP